jgi:predicted methyltransferase
MRFSLVFLALGLLAACSPTTESQGAPQARTEGGFPLPDRPVAGIVAPEWSTGPDRDAADESGQLIRGLEIGPGMKVADIGAGSGYHTLRLSPAVGPTGRVYAEDIVEAYISGLRREAERRKLTNVRIVVGTPDDPKLPAKSIDRAVLVHMYHEVENPYALLWHLAGSLKPGARVGVIDLDRTSASHGMPPALLKCEFEAVGYKQLSSEPMAGGVGYLAIFEAPTRLPEPADIVACNDPNA